MDQKYKLKYQKDVEQYLQKENVYEIFEDIVKSLIIHQPKDPIDHMIKILERPETQRVFIVGPPGSKVQQLGLEIADLLQINTINVGDLLKKEISKKSELGQKIQNAAQNVQYVNDDIVIGIVQKAIEQSESKGSYAYVLQGFPKTRAQGLALQKAGIIPNTFIILTHSQQKVLELSKHKLNNSEGFYSHLSTEQKTELSQNLTMEYLLNISHVQEIYDQFYFQVDGEMKQQDILEDMGKLLKFKINNKSPHLSARILILGPPGSGRSTLGKKLSEKYGFVYLSTMQMISNEISQQTEVGRACLEMVNKGELVKQDIIKSIMVDRINQTDCNMQGYAIDGYPKTKQQLEDLQLLKINPSFIIVLECGDDVVFQRFNEKQIDPITGIVYDKFNPTNNNDVAKRLQNNPNQTKQIIEQRQFLDFILQFINEKIVSFKRLQRWKDLLKSVEQKYSQIIIKISANAPPENILERVSSHITNYHKQKKSD